MSIGQDGQAVFQHGIVSYQALHKTHIPTKHAPPLRKQHGQSFNRVRYWKTWPTIGRAIIQRVASNAFVVLATQQHVCIRPIYTVIDTVSLASRQTLDFCI